MASYFQGFSLVVFRLASHPGATWKNFEVVKTPAPYDMAVRKQWDALEKFLKCVFTIEDQEERVR